MKMILKALKSHRGSGILTVIISVAFVAMLGAVLMFTSYTGFQIKVSDRGSKSNFYEAESVLNEIRAGIQLTVSESIAKAYTDVLIQYNTAYTDPQRAFSNCFVDALKSRGFLVPNLSGDYIVEVTTLKDYITDQSLLDSGLLTVTFDGRTDVTSENVTLRGIKVSLIKNGFESNISSDIVIKMPEFSYTHAGKNVGVSMHNLVSVARESFEVGIGATITGNAYAGSLEARGGTFTINDNSMLVCKGGVNVMTGVNVIGTADSTIWAGDISIGSNGSVDLEGKTFVADDLDLAGTNASAVLSGQYYGFGKTDVAAYRNDQAGVASRSSAILVNGTNTTLDLTGLSKLMLAGHSFVTIGENAVMMGESISIKSNQLAYLVPSLWLGGEVTGVTSNPYVYRTGGGGGIAGAVTRANNALTTQGIRARCQTFDTQLSGAPDYRVVYFFLKFDTARDAEDYFAAYFASGDNMDSISKYLGLYSARLDSISGSQHTTAGSTISLEDGNAVLTGSSAGLPVSAERLAQMFTNSCQTMNTSFGAAVNDPFDYLVNTTAVSALSSGTYEFKDDGGNVIAILHTGSNYYTSLAPASTKIIVVSGGNVDAPRDLTGLILCDKKVRLNASLTAPTSESITKALYSVCDELINEPLPDGSVSDGSLYHYLRNTGVIETSGSGSTGSSWDVNYLVSYANWTKS